MRYMQIPWTIQKALIVPRHVGPSGFTFVLQLADKALVSGSDVLVEFVTNDTVGVAVQKVEFCVVPNGAWHRLPKKALVWSSGSPTVIKQGSPYACRVDGRCLDSIRWLLASHPPDHFSDVFVNAVVTYDGAVPGTSSGSRPGGA